MQKTLDRLKQKPAHVRERIAYTGTLLVFVVIALFWVWTLNFRFQDNSKTASASKAFNPFSIIKDSVAGIYSDIKNSASVGSTQYQNISAGENQTQ